MEVDAESLATPSGAGGGEQSKSRATALQQQHAAVTKSADMLADVRGLLESIMGEQFSRLLAAGQLKAAEVGAISAILHEARLTPELMEQDLAQELKAVCSIRYDAPMKGSTRLEGYGWSLGHMQSHMERLLRVKLQALATVFRTKAAPPSAASRASAVGAAASASGGAEQEENVSAT